MRWILIACVCFCCSCHLLRNSTVMNFPQRLGAEHSLLKVDGVVFRPLLWGYTPSRVKNAALRPSMMEHPLKMARNAFAALYYGKLHDDQALIGIGRSMLDSLAHYPHVDTSGNADTYQYPFPHKDIPAGWWSGMANGTVSLAFLLGAEIFHSSVYLNKAERAYNGLIFPVRKNGSTLMTRNGNAWFLEYSHKRVRRKDAYFVMNGFLYALLHIRTLDMVFPDKGFDQYYDAGLSALKEMNGQFYYADSAWTYYMLQPPTPESLHYCIFDLLLFESLYAVDKNPFYVSQLKARRAILKKAFPVFVSSGPDSHRYLFSLLGPPHPYWLDSYAIGLDLYHQGKLIRHLSKSGFTDTKIPFKERAFLTDTISLRADSFRVYSLFSGDTVLLHTGSDFIPMNSKYQSISPKRISAFDNADIRKDEILMLPYEHDSTVNKAFNICSWEFTLDSPVLLNQFPYFGIRLNCPVPVLSVRVTFTGVDGGVMGRTYIPPHAGKDNLLLMHWTGFRPEEKMGTGAIRSMRVYLYPEKDVFDVPTKVIISPLVFFHDQVAIHEYFSVEDFVFPEKMR